MNETGLCKFYNLCCKSLQKSTMLGISQLSACPTHDLYVKDTSQSWCLEVHSFMMRNCVCVNCHQEYTLFNFHGEELSWAMSCVCCVCEDQKSALFCDKLYFHVWWSETCDDQKWGEGIFLNWACDDQKCTLYNQWWVALAELCIYVVLQRAWSPGSTAECFFDNVLNWTWG